MLGPMILHLSQNQAKFVFSKTLCSAFFKVEHSKWHVN
jgi:hypothetical protein